VAREIFQELGAHPDAERVAHGVALGLRAGRLD
jgi:hypothetical protein